MTILNIHDERETRLQKIINKLAAITGDYYGAESAVRQLADMARSKELQDALPNIDAMTRHFEQRFERKPAHRNSEKFYRKFQRPRFR